MKINPNLKKINTIFYNNICIIVLVFVVLCFMNCFSCVNSSKIISQGYNTKNGQILGPINVGKKPIIYEIEANFQGRNTGIDLSIEVLDENKDTLYEVGKDLWEENGHDSEGYWSEGATRMVARLNFYNAGKYYLKFSPADVNKNLIIKIKKSRGSYVPYFIMGFWLLIISLIAFGVNNRDWVKAINDSMEED